MPEPLRIFGSTPSSNRLLCTDAADRERAVESVDTFNTKKWCIQGFTLSSGATTGAYNAFANRQQLAVNPADTFARLAAAC